MKRLIATALTALALTLAMSVTALATPDDYEPRGSECGQYHGAFEYYSHMRGYWIPGAAQERGGLGHTTGPANSAKGCQSHF